MSILRRSISGLLASTLCAGLLSGGLAFGSGGDSAENCQKYFTRFGRQADPQASNYYDVLGVDPSATPEDIKMAYRKGAALFHPDRNPSPTAAQDTQKVNEAYATLSDPEKRKAYDRTLATPGRARAASPPTPPNWGPVRPAPFMAEDPVMAFMKPFTNFYHQWMGAGMDAGLKAAETHSKNFSETAMSANRAARSFFKDLKDKKAASMISEIETAPDVEKAAQLAAHAMVTGALEEPRYPEDWIERIAKIHGERFEDVTEAFMRSTLDETMKHQGRYKWTTANFLLMQCIRHLSKTKEGFEKILKFSIEYNQRDFGKSFESSDRDRINFTIGTEVYEAVTNNPRWLPKKPPTRATKEELELYSVGRRIFDERASRQPAPN